MSANPEVFGSGNVPQKSDTLRMLLVKEVNATIGSGGSGTGGAGVVGTGSPEGVVTAPPGTSYFDSNGDHYWYKKTGSGNTGWTELIA